MDNLEEEEPESPHQLFEEYMLLQPDFNPSWLAHNGYRYIVAYVENEWQLWRYENYLFGQSKYLH